MPHRRRTRAALCLLLGLLAVPAPAAGTSAEAPGPTVWSIRPTPVEGQPERSNFAFALAPTQSLADSVRIRNFGRSPLGLTLYASDARTAAGGALDLLPAGEAPRRVGAWIRLERSSVELAPGELVDVPFTLTVPQDAESGDLVGGIVSALSTQATGDGPVRVEQRLANLVHLRVDGTLRPALTVSSLSVDYRGTANPLGRGEVVATYTVVNSGNVRMAAQQALRVRGPLGLEGRRIFLDPLPELLPGDTRTVTARLPGVAPTVRSSVQVELRPLATRPGEEFGAEVAIAKRTTGTWTVPWTLLGLLALLVGASVGGLWWRLRRTMQVRSG
ncbi:MAG: WxL protein peptidoglycan domain-containing protein [Sporichthyaceae bacterium]